MTSTNYTMSTPSGTLRLDGVIIEQGGTDPAYLIYVDWIRAGNGPTFIDDPIPEFPRITVDPYQFGKALAQQGLLDQFHASVEGSSDAYLKAFYRFAREWHSDSPALAANLGTLGFTEQGLYDLFMLASGLPAVDVARVPEPPPVM